MFQVYLWIGYRWLSFNPPHDTMISALELQKRMIDRGYQTKLEEV